jgi:hypothetical protein
VLLGLAAFGGVAYAASLSLQALQGGEIKPLPFSSQSLWATLGKISDRSATGSSPLGELSAEIANPSGYLDPIERAEYQILAGNLTFAECVFSSAKHPASRWGLWQLVARKFADGTINEYFALNEIEDARDLAPRLRSAEALLGNPERYSVTALGMEVETWELTPVAPVEQKRVRSKEAKAIPPAPPEPSPWDAAEAEPVPVAASPIEATRAYAERQVAELERQAEISTAVRDANSKIEAFDFINDVATASGEPWPKSIMWLGPSRSGKSWAMAASLQESVNYWESEGQSVGVWWISAKHDPAEHDYAHGRGYQACSEVQVDELERDELEDVFGDWYNLLNEFKMAKHFDKRFFVFDEMNLAASLCTPNTKTGFQPGQMAAKFWQSLISQAIACPSNGRGQGKALWVASQMSSMQSLGLSTDQCGVFHEQIIFLSPTAKKSQFEKGALRNGFISEYLDPFQIKKGETGRFYHYQGRWRGLPVINMPEKSLNV